MQMQHLKAFYDVAQSGSFLAASKKARITQPALSRAVKNLEDSLERSLFVREARGVSLTAEGREVFERCRRIFAECDAIAAKVITPTTIIKLAASENLCLHVLPAILSLKKRALELTSGTASEVIASVMSSASDIGYCYHSAKSVGINSKAVAEVPFVVVVSGKSSANSIKDLSSIPFVGSKSRDYSGPFAAKSLLGQLGLRKKEASLQCNSQEAQIAFVENDLGFSIVPWFSARSRVKAGKLKEIPSKARLSSTLFSITKEMFAPTELQREIEREIQRLVVR